MLGDIQYAFRLLARSPAFTVVAVLTLALGVGTNTAIFSLADGMLFRPLPFGDPERLVLIQGFDRKSGETYSRILRTDLEQIRQHHTGIEDVAVLEQGGRYTLTGSDGVETISTAEGSPNFLHVLRASAHLGRPLQPGDERIEPRPAMLLYGSWQRRFGGDPSVVGRILTFDQAAVQIVGVLPERFIYPLQGALVTGDMLLTAAPRPSEAVDPQAGVWTPIARLERGVSIEQAQSELDVLVQRAGMHYGETSQDHALRVSNLQYALFEVSRPLLLLLLSAAGFVLLIACVNLASLLLARGTGREREIGIRSAIGAPRGRIVRQLLVESLVLSVLGGTTALVLASITFDVLSSWVPSRFRLVPDGLDMRAALFAMGIAVMSGLAFGMLPALRLSSPSLQRSLREGPKGRAASGIMKAGAPLVAAEVALGLILLTGTGLMINSLVRMRSVDLGFNPAGVTAMGLVLPASRYPTPQHRYDHYNELLARLRAQLGVPLAAIDTPQIPGLAPPTGLRRNLPRMVGVWSVTPGYFATVGLPIVQGRDLTEAEMRSDAPVAVINESAARLLWPNQPALGRSLEMENAPALTVIGVVKDVRQAYGAPVTLSVYRPFSEPRSRVTIVARASGDPSMLATLMRTEAQRMDPRIVIPRPEPLADILEQNLAGRKFQTSLFVLFGVLGVCIAAVGIYGVIGYWVGARAHEMGVRAALGASPVQLTRLVVRQASIPLMGGLVLGAAGAFALARRLENLLYEITPHDPATLGLVILFLLIVGLAAAYVPARRAARVDPMVALRGE